MSGDLRVISSHKIPYSCNINTRNPRRVDLGHQSYVTKGLAVCSRPRPTKHFNRGLERPVDLSNDSLFDTFISKNNPASPQTVTSAALAGGYEKKEDKERQKRTETRKEGKREI